MYALSTTGTEPVVFSPIYLVKGQERTVGIPSACHEPIFWFCAAAIALTVPAVLLISGVINEPIHLGLEPAEMVLLVATLLMTSVSFSSGRTNSLNGATHLILFFAYTILMFD